MGARHVNGNGFNNYFYNVSEYTTTLGPSRLAGLQLPFHTTPWHRVLGCPVHEPAIHALRAWNCGYALETRKIYNTHYFSNKYLSFSFTHRVSEWNGGWSNFSFSFFFFFFCIYLLTRLNYNLIWQIVRWYIRKSWYENHDSSCVIFIENSSV